MLTEMVSLKLILFFSTTLRCHILAIGCAIPDVNKVPQLFKRIHGLRVKTSSKLQK